MKSIIQSKRECYICHSKYQLEEHHLFQGPNRNQAEKQGLKVYLCRNCHYTVHNMNYQELNKLHILGQKKFEETHTREEFMALFHKNYIMEEE